MREYIAYARQTCFPRLTKATKELLVHHYVEMRQEGKDAKTISATTRQLESFVRISEALAKMELSAKIQPKHVAEAVRLVKSALRSSFVDKTGRLDLDLMFAGVSQEERALRQFVADEVQSLLSTSKKLPFMQLLEKLNARGSHMISQQSLRDALSLIRDTVSIEAGDMVTLLESDN